MIDFITKGILSGEFMTRGEYETANPTTAKSGDRGVAFTFGETTVWVPLEFVLNAFAWDPTSLTIEQALAAFKNDLEVGRTAWGANLMHIVAPVNVPERIAHALNTDGISATDGARNYIETVLESSNLSNPAYTIPAKLIAGTAEVPTELFSGLLTDDWYAGFTPPLIPAPTPETDTPAGEVAADTQVTLSCEDEDATIYVTVDGTEPTDASLEYTMPIIISADTTVKAVAYKEGMAPSAVITLAYTIEVV